MEQKKDNTPLEKKLIKNVGEKKRQINRLSYSVDFYHVYLLKLIARLPNRMEEIQKLLMEQPIKIWWPSEDYADIGELTTTTGRRYQAFINKKGEFFAKLSEQKNKKLHLVEARSLWDLLCEGYIKIDWKLIDELDIRGGGTRFYSLLKPIDCNCKTCTDISAKLR